MINVGLQRTKEINTYLCFCLFEFIKILFAHQVVYLQKIIRQEKTIAKCLNFEKHRTPEDNLALWNLKEIF